MTAQRDGAASGFNGLFDDCFAHGERDKHNLHSTASDTFIEDKEGALTVPPMKPELGQALRKARQDKGLTLKQVAAKLNISYPAVQQWEAGTTNPSTENLLKVQELLEADLFGSLRVAEAAMDRAPVEEPANAAVDREMISPPMSYGPRDIPVLGIAVGGGDSDGDFRFNGETVDRVTRPPSLAHKRRAFAVEVTNSSMYPRFSEGTRVYVDPDRHASIGDNVLVELKPSEDGEPGAAYIKALVKRTPTKVIVEQFNPTKVIEFDLAAVKSVYRVIPWDELLGM